MAQEERKYFKKSRNLEEILYLIVPRNISKEFCFTGNSKTEAFFFFVERKFPQKNPTVQKKPKGF